MPSSHSCASLEELRRVSQAFDLPGVLVDGAAFGNGLINDTYAITCEDSGIRTRFILQRINHHVFRDPVSLMGNVERVCHHIRQRLDDDGGAEPARRSLTLLHARDGASFHHQPAARKWRRRGILLALLLLHRRLHQLRGRRNPRPGLSGCPRVRPVPMPRRRHRRRPPGRDHPGFPPHPEALSGIPRRHGKRSPRPRRRLPRRNRIRLVPRARRPSPLCNSMPAVSSRNASPTTIPNSPTSSSTTNPPKACALWISTP